MPGLAVSGDHFNIFSIFILNIHETKWTSERENVDWDETSMMTSSSNKFELSFKMPTDLMSFWNKNNFPHSGGGSGFKSNNNSSLRCWQLTCRKKWSSILQTFEFDPESHLMSVDRMPKDWFLIGHSRTLVIFNFAFLMHITENVQYKFWRWLDSNCRPVESAATALPTGPQPLPIV